ncbi:hypothetical protein H1R20_g91, partial [Candolleomyces eurysporus]
MVSPAVAPSPREDDEAETANPGTIFITLDDSDDDLGDAFEIPCDEEPHMIGPPMSPGYIPLHLGQQFTDLDRGPEPFSLPHPAEGYEIVRKLGWGQEGSVWLARRLENASQTSFVAIKFLTASITSACIQKESFELNALLALTKGAMDHPGRTYCTLLLDIFIYPDIKSDNIFIDAGVQDEVIAKYLADNPSRTYPVRHDPSLSPDPIITVMSEPLPPFNSPDRDALRIKLGDFGAAIPQNETHRFPTVMPTSLRAPEVILGCPWGWQVDIWMVGCLMFDRVHSRPIFNLRGVPEGIKVADVHLTRMQELLGPFPSSFLDRCSRRDKYFDKSGKLLRKPDSTTLTGLGDLEQRMSELKGRVPYGELAELVNFMRRCLTIDPELRPSAEELLEDPFLAD